MRRPQQRPKASRRPPPRPVRRPRQAAGRRRAAARRRRAVWSVVGTALCLGVLTVGALWSQRGTPLAVLGSLRPPFGGRRRVNILVLGIDDGQGGKGRSDTMLLVHVDTETRRLSALSIPRDTRVPISHGRYAKINAAHARGGPHAAARAVSALTGLPVDYTLTTDFAGFSRMVDLVGGIDLNVERPMDYDDHWGHLQIHLKPGFQHLDGEQAIQYVRFRKTSGPHPQADGSDISRIARQQRFLSALASRCFVGENLARLPELVHQGQREIRTDLATTDLLYLAGLAKENGVDQLKLLTVPGTTAMIGGQSYWLPAPGDLAAVLKQLDGASEPAGNTLPVEANRNCAAPGAAADRG